MAKFPLPKTPYGKIEEIIIKYYEINREVTIKEIANYSKIGGISPFSRNHSFLVAIGILVGDERKRLTENGKLLGSALKNNISEDVSKYWKKIVQEDTFLNNLISRLASKVEMSENELVRYIHSLSQTTINFKEADAGARAILKILVEAGLVKCVDKRYKIEENTERIIKETNNLVFVVMAFQPDMQEIYEGINSAVKKFGLTAKRVLDVHGGIRITDKIISMIESAKYVVVDLTHERQNVYFELGFARGLGNKKIITIAREGTVVHFDIKDWRYIPYTDSRVVEKELTKWFENEIITQD